MDFQGPMELLGFLSPSRILDETSNPGFGIPAYAITTTYLSPKDGPIKPMSGPLLLSSTTYDSVGPDEQFDILLIPGGYGTRPNVVSPSLIEFVKRQAPGAKYVLSVCTGSWVLAMAGLLKGKRATTNKAVFVKVREATKDEHINWVPKARWVVDGKYWTSSGITAGCVLNVSPVAPAVGTPLDHYLVPSRRAAESSPLPYNSTVTYAGLESQIMSTVGSVNLQSPLSHVSHLAGFDVWNELREAADSPTPLAELLHDPIALRSLIGHRKSRRPSGASTSSREHRDPGTSSSSRPTEKIERKKDKESDASSILTLVLAEEERQAHHLKALLRTTGERLENETRRADQAERRANAAESVAREANSRLSGAETGKHQSELDVARAREEIAKYRAQADVLERDLRRAEVEVQKLERLRSDAEYAANEAKEVGRKAQQTLREWQAREEGREDSWKINVMRRYNDGREDGFEDGRAEGYEAGHAEGYEEGHEAGTSEGRTEGYNAGRLAGFEEGKNVGWQEGFEEGLERGRKEAREEALRAFDKFVASEFEHRPPSFVSDGEPEEDRTQEWVESTRKSLNRSGSHSSQHGNPRNNRQFGYTVD
ncbi:hypothetical protein EUX98_g7483 [Antrodiella citrinella]|uniref:DJ-1/PfpI domain-containing protein n=1 Tax=Antrodiella citrinella TaxID=2447956 RepID=A0A4S4MLZ7_9APHY|nr:hypothetical protein EUX98_g7483 [Antrodiella citrinella]